MIDNNCHGTPFLFIHIIVLSQYPKTPNRSNALWRTECVDFLRESSHPFRRISYLFYRRHVRPRLRHEGQLMITITIWHNPRCSKSRTALALLEERGVKPTCVKYLETPPTEKEIRHVLSLLGVSAIDLMRCGEAMFKELNLSSERSEDELVSAMASHPILIERPVIISATQAVIGRPPENALTLL